MFDTFSVYELKKVVLNTIHGPLESEEDISMHSGTMKGSFYADVAFSRKAIL